MVAYEAGRAWPAVASDVLALPFREGAFDAALAGFLLNHLPPVPALAEIARVVRPGGAVLGSTWARRPDPVKAAIDAVVARWGWEPPVWYQAIKDEVEPVSGDPSSLADAARQAGLVDVSASVRRPDLGVRGPRALVAYRLAVPHIASWLATLGAPARDEVARQALAAVRHIGQWRPAVIILAGRVEGQPSGPAARSRAWA
jgi:SAM-dependent methyltransferase